MRLPSSPLGTVLIPSSPLGIVLAVLFTGFWVIALVDVVRSPRRDWYNPRGKALTFLLVTFVAAYIANVFIPVGAIVWFAWWRDAGGLGHLPVSRRSAPNPN